MNQFTPCEIVYELETADTEEENERGSEDPSGDSVRLEQAEFEGGLLTYQDWLQDNGRGASIDSAIEYQEQKASICADDGHIDITIHAYPSRPDLEYRMEATYGELTQGASETSANVDRVRISYDTSYTVSGTLEGAVSARWDGPVFGEGGIRIEPPPTIEIDGGEITWGGESVLGTLALSYGLQRDVWVLTLFPRDEGEYDGDDNEDAYASTVTAFWGSTGYTELDVEIPDLDGYCITGGGLVVNDGDDERCYDRRLVVDPCTGEVLSDQVVEVACPETPGNDPDQVDGDGNPSE